MQIVCAWCEKEMGEKEPLRDPSVTHGICDLCQVGIANEVKELEKRRGNVLVKALDAKTLFCP